MSEDPHRKSIPRKDVEQRLQSSSIKASGDATPRKKASRSKSKCRIPKSLRDDLENALVGLCDVWFEEIKPYLVQNNIKIHLHNDTGDGSGDRGLITGNCSHLDPGRSDRRHRTNVNYADCCSTLPTVLKAQHHKQPAPQPSPVVAATTQTPFKWKKKTPRKRRKCRDTQPIPRQPIPRLCHSYTIPILPTTEKNMNITQNKYFKDLISRRKPQLKHAATQTDELSTKSIAAKKVINTNYPKTKLSPCPPTTYKQSQQENEYPLFSDDLIDLIATKHDKKLQVLYMSPRKDNCSSIMNLCGPAILNRNRRGCNKIPPWR